MEIVPFESVGELRFGDTRDLARRKLASPFTGFHKDVGEEPTDSFDGLGLHIYYDKAGLIEFVEAFTPAEITCCGVRFLGRFVDEIAADMRRLGHELQEGDVGPDFPTAGIALTASIDETVDGVAAHRAGYYD